MRALLLSALPFLSFHPLLPVPTLDASAFETPPVNTNRHEGKYY